MQETNSASGATPARTGAGTEQDADRSTVDALRSELAKWQARVPKLASALRERTAEVEALKAQAGNPEMAAAMPAGSGIQARDALIRELEGKVKALGGRYQDAEGQLHARDLEIGRLRQEAEDWREKWRNLTGALDAQADGVERKERELKRVQRELDELLALQETQKGRLKAQDLELTTLRERSQSLESRNQNLFETTELANRQIETLGENLAHLRAELKVARQTLAGHDPVGDIARAREETAAVEARLRDKEEAVAVLRDEIDRLKACVSAADEATGRFEAERRQISGQLDELTRRNRHLEAQLAERSNLVVGLEQEKSAISDRHDSLQADNARLTEALDRAEKAAAGNADHIAQVDARLERQKELMANLEAEFASVQEEHAETVKAQQRVLREREAQIATLQAAVDGAGEAVATEAPGAAEAFSGENAQLQAEVQKLEGMVRERTEQLNKLRWQQDMLEKQGQGAPADGRMLLVLNQQLQTAREENGRLRDTIRSLEASRSTGAGNWASGADAAGDVPERDNLVRIKGIGPKLCKQLRRLGISRFDQIAALSEADLDDPGHPLHGMKGRVIKDDWITQAAKLSGALATPHGPFTSGPA